MFELFDALRKVIQKTLKGKVLPKTSGAKVICETLPYPLVNIQKAIENGPVEIVDLPSYKMVDLFIVVRMFTISGKHPFSYGFPMGFLWATHCRDKAVDVLIMNNGLRGGVLGHWITVSLKAEGYNMFHSVGNVIITDFHSYFSEG